MATLHFDAAGDTVTWTPASALSALPNGAGTIAVLVRHDSTGDDDLAGLIDAYPTPANFYHSLATTTGNKLFDDDGLVGVTSTAGTLPTGTTADDYWCAVVDWPSGGAALQRFHFSTKITTSITWTHTNSTANNGGNRAGPSPGVFGIGDIKSLGALLGDIAVVGVWAGTRLSDAQVTELMANKRTSDWWNNSAGRPTFLSELTSTTPTDIGNNASTFSSINSATLAGLNPTGWIFNGRGGDTTQVLRYQYSDTMTSYPEVVS